MIRRLLPTCLVMALMMPLQVSAFSPNDFKPISTNTCAQVTYSMCSDPNTIPPMFCSPARYTARCEELVAARLRTNISQQLNQDALEPRRHADRLAAQLVVEDVLEEEVAHQAGAQVPTLNQLMTPQEQLNAASLRLDSCQDYVQQGGNDYFAFQVVARHFGDRHDLLFDYAYSAQHKDEGALGFRGVTMPAHQINASARDAYLPEFQAKRLGDEFGFRAKNDFFAFDQAAFAVIAQRQPGIAAKLTQGVDYHHVDNLFDFHFLAKFALRQYEPEALAFYKQKREAFRQLLKQRSDINQQLVRQRAPADQAYWQGLLATVDDELEQAWVEADQLGCLDDPWPSTFHPCDWSHKDFSDEVHQRYGSAATAQLNACIDATGDDLQNLPPHYALRLRPDKKYEPYVVTQLDRLANATNFLTYLRDRKAVNQWAAAQAAGPARTRPKFAHAYSQTHERGDDLFGASWSSQSAWRVERGKNACDTELFASTSFEADATVFGYTQQLLDVQASHATSGVSQSGQLSVWVLGMAAPNQGTKRYTYVPKYDYNIIMEDHGGLEQRQDLVRYDETFFIVGFPITVGAGVTGRVGIRGEGFARGQGDVHCKDGVERHLEGQYEPYTSLKAFAEGAAGVTGLRVGAGAELDLLSITQPLQFKLRATSPDALIDTTQVTILNTGEQQINAMNGRLYGFVEYPTGIDVSFDGVSVIYTRSKKTFGSYDGYEDRSSMIDNEFSSPIGVMNMVCQRGGYSCE